MRRWVRRELPNRKKYAFVPFPWNVILWCEVCMFRIFVSETKRFILSTLTDGNLIYSSKSPGPTAKTAQEGLEARRVVSWWIKVTTPQERLGTVVQGVARAQSGNPSWRGEEAKTLQGVSSFVSFPMIHWILVVQYSLSIRRLVCPHDSPSRVSPSSLRRWGYWFIIIIDLYYVWVDGKLILGRWLTRGPIAMGPSVALGNPTPW